MRLAEDLRRRAEEVEQRETAYLLKDLEALTPEETIKKFHELRVHQIEIEMQNEELIQAQAALDALRERYYSLYELAPVGYLIINTQGLILESNLTTVNMLGLARGILLKKSLNRFIFKEDQDIYYLHLKQISETGEAQAFDMRMLKKDGTVFWANLIITTMDEAESILGYRVVLSDITERKKAEENIKASLLEKETLLKEIHHRVKNNLQVISSLLGLQSSYLQDEKAKEMLRNSIERVSTMARIHTMLYQSADLTRVDFGSFIRDLAGRLQQSYGIVESPVEIHVNAPDVSLTIGTSIPCGLILNELVSNALKHAFPAQGPSEPLEPSEPYAITVTMTEDSTPPSIIERSDSTLHTQGLEPLTLNLEHRTLAKQITLTISDNGIGFPEGVDFFNPNSLGLELVNLLLGQINGTITMTVDEGTTFIITFPEVKKGG